MAGQGWTPEWHQAQIEQYLQQHRIYVLYADLLQRLFERVCEKLTEMGRVEARAKSPASFAEKAVRKYEKYKDPIHQLTDLCGVRVITYTKIEAERVSAFILRNFTIDRENSLDASERLKPKEFGYLANHFVVQMPWMGLLGRDPFRKAIDELAKDWNVNLCGYLTRIGDEEADIVFRRIMMEASREEGFDIYPHLAGVMEDGLDPLKEAMEDLVEALRVDPDFGSALRLVYQIGNRKAEIQVATALQNAWAAIGHERIYKGEIKPPAPLERDVNRVAALLEECDETLSRAIAEVDEYGRKYLAYMGKERIEAEIAKWQSVARGLRGDSVDQAKLALRIAGLAATVEDWRLVRETLDPFRERATERPEILYYLGLAKAMEPRRDQTACGSPPRLGPALNALVKAGRPDPTGRIDPRPHRCMGDLLCKFHPSEDPNPCGPPAYVCPGDCAAKKHYKAAFDADPEDPTALCRYLECRICGDGNITVLTLLGPVLRAAREKARKRAVHHIDIPLALFELGELEILLDDPEEGKPYEGLGAYAKAAYLSEEEHPIEEALTSIRKLQGGVDPSTRMGENLKWACLFLNLARFAKKLRRPSVKDAIALRSKRREEFKAALKRWRKRRDTYREAQKKATQPGSAIFLDGDEEPLNWALCERECTARHEKDRAMEAGRAAQGAYRSARSAVKDAEERAKQKRDVSSFVDLGLHTEKFGRLDWSERRVAIVVGTCDIRYEYEMRAYRELILESFRDFEGLICSGGTNSGIGKIVGDVQAKYDPKGEKRRIETLAYLPRNLPDGVKKNESYTHVLESVGEDFSPLQPIQNWIDLFAAGVEPSDVRVLGLDGGPITALEYRIALALGAWVAVLEKGGREAARLLPDEDWGKVEKLVVLPREAPVIREYVGRPKDLPGWIDVEELAIKVHGKYVKDVKDGLCREKPEVADWKDLTPDLKESNREQVKSFSVILREGKFKITAESPPKAPEFCPEQIERMAEEEHARFLVERFLAGWKLGEKKDIEKKISPSLIGWRKLVKDRPEDTEKDYNAVKAIPEHLKDVGAGVSPTEEKPPTPKASPAGDLPPKEGETKEKW